MQVATIDEDKYKAREKYAEYLKACKANPRSKGYRAAKAAYRELAKGAHIIDINATMMKTGMDEIGRPKLAIVRADFQECYFRENYHQWNWLPAFRGGNGPSTAADVIFASDIFPRGKAKFNIKAIVPTIPPALMPSDSLTKYHILWEADWQDVPVDPMLLRSLGMGLYKVIAAWDMTPIERAVLRGSLRA